MGPMGQEAKAARACARSCTCPFLGTLSESLPGVMAYFVIWKAVLYHIDIFESSWIQARRYLGGSLASCLVTLMVSDFGRVIYLTCSDLTQGARLFMTLSGDHDHDDMTRTRMHSDTGILGGPAAASYRIFGRG